eukprot:220513-Hanusia_phi.AAC.2
MVCVRIVKGEAEGRAGRTDQIAKAAKGFGCKNCHIVTSTGANSKSSMMDVASFRVHVSWQASHTSGPKEESKNRCSALLPTSW